MSELTQGRSWALQRGPARGRALQRFPGKENGVGHGGETKRNLHRVKPPLALRVGGRYAGSSSLPALGFRAAIFTCTVCWEV